MRLNDYQLKAVSTAYYPDKSTNIIYPTIGLCAETGEFVNLIKRMIRDGPLDLQRCVDELGDIMWYLATVAWELNLDLETIAQANIDKVIKKKEIKNGYNYQ